MPFVGSFEPVLPRWPDKPDIVEPQVEVHERVRRETVEGVAVERSIESTTSFGRYQDEETLQTPRARELCEFLASAEFPHLSSGRRPLFASYPGENDFKVPIRNFEIRSGFDSIRGLKSMVSQYRSI